MAGHISSNEKTVAVTPVAGNPNAKYANVQIIQFTDNQQIAPFEITIKREDRGVTVIASFNPTGQKGAGINKGADSMRIILKDGPAILGEANDMPWWAACHQENPFLYEKFVENVDFDRINFVTIPVLNAVDYAC